MSKVPKLRTLATLFLLVSLLALAVPIAMAPGAGAVEVWPCAYTGYAFVDGAPVPDGTGILVLEDSTALGNTTTGAWALDDNEYYLDGIMAEVGTEVNFEIWWDCGEGAGWLAAAETAIHVMYGRVEVDLHAGCPYDLTVVAEPPEGGIVTGNGTYDYCTDAAITATPADACWYFDGWTGDGILDPNAASTTVHIDGDKTVTASFAKFQYTLTVAAAPPGGGDVTGSGTYDCCTDAAITATPADACWYFDGWTGAGILDPNAASTTVHIDGNKTVTASFAKIQYTLTVVADPPGGGDVTGSGTYDCCTNQTITATQNVGWAFTEWTGDGIADPNAASTSVHIDANKTVTATFVPSGLVTIHINVNPFLFVYPGPDCPLPEALTNIGPDGLDVVIIVWGTAEVESVWQWVSFDPVSEGGLLGDLGLEEGKPYVMQVTGEGVCNDWEMCFE